MNGSSLISVSFLAALLLTSLMPERSCGTKSKSTQSGQVNQQESKPAAASLPAGIWGGEHIQMEVTAEGASIEYDCAQSMIPTPLRPDSEGRFQVQGTFAFEHGGPIREGETPASRPVDYTGVIKGQRMTLSVKFTDAAEILDTFTLTQGSEGQLFKCR